MVTVYNQRVHFKDIFLFSKSLKAKEGGSKQAYEISRNRAKQALLCTRTTRMSEQCEPISDAMGTNTRSVGLASFLPAEEGASSYVNVQMRLSIICSR